MCRLKFLVFWCGHTCQLSRTSPDCRVCARQGIFTCLRRYGRTQAQCNRTQTLALRLCRRYLSC